MKNRLKYLFWCGVKRWKGLEISTYIWLHTCLPLQKLLKTVLDSSTPWCRTHTHSLVSHIATHSMAHAYSHLNFNKLLRHRVCASIPLFTRTHHNHNKMKWNGKKLHGYNNKLSNESILCSKFVDCRHVESQCQKHLHHYCHCHKYHQHHSVRIAVRHFSFSVLLVLHTFFLSYSV